MTELLYWLIDPPGWALALGFVATAVVATPLLESLARTIHIHIHRRRAGRRS